MAANTKKTQRVRPKFMSDEIFFESRKTMIRSIYQVIIGIVGRCEPQAKNEIEVLDKIFGGSNW